MMTPEQISARWIELLEENQQYEGLCNILSLTVEQYMEEKGLSPFLNHDDPELIAQLRAQLRKEVLDSRESVFIEDPPSVSENNEHNDLTVYTPLRIIEPQPASVIERIKKMGDDAVYVLQDLLLDPEVSDRVRLDAVKAVIAIVEAEKNKELTVATEGAADLDELERLIREGGFDL